MKKFLLYVAVGLYAAIQIALIVAKLAHRLDWAWGWILTPIWGPVALVIAGVMLLIAFLGRESAAGRNPFQ